MEYLGFVSRDIPLFHKCGRYKIVDPVLRTWYHLVEPIQELLDLENIDEALGIVLSRLDTFVASVWEDVVGMYLHKVFGGKGFTQRGRLVKKREEIDLALIDPENKKAIVAEIK